MKTCRILCTIALCFLAISFSTNVEAKRIIKRTTSGGSSNGYNSTSKALGSNTDADGNVTTGWIINCEDPGQEKCPCGSWLSAITCLISPGGDVDVIDADKANDLAMQASDAIKSGTLTGSYILQVTVAGESFTRNYKVSWSSSDTDGTTSTVVVDRFDS